METDLKSYRSDFVPISCNQGLSEFSTIDFLISGINIDKLLQQMVFLMIEPAN